MPILKAILYYSRPDDRFYQVLWKSARVESNCDVHEPSKALTSLALSDSETYSTKSYYRRSDPIDEISAAMKLSQELPVKSYLYLLRLHKSGKYGERMF
jgi:hypothetical protein